MQDSHQTLYKDLFLRLCCPLCPHQADYRSGLRTLGDIPHWLIEMNYHHRRMKVQVLSPTDIYLTYVVAKLYSAIMMGEVTQYGPRT